MWKTLYQSVQGTSHERIGQPCQDSCAAAEVALARETVLVLACSDGAGSAEFSQDGSRLACDTLVELVAAELRLGAELPQIDAVRGNSWVAEVHKALGALADSREIEVRKLACTLLFAVLGQRGAAFGQIGDGAIVLRRDGAYEHVFWPQSGEYANTTNFVTDPRFASFFEFRWQAEPVDEVALFSDGLQMLGLDFQKQQAHAGFFAPMFASLRAQQSADDLAVPLRTFLESPAVVERTDDDKTLILATRVEA